MRHVPSPVARGITQSPCFTDLTAEPVARTSKHASFPGTALGDEVDREFVNGGRLGYVPWIWLMSAGFSGELRVRRVRSEE